jgi:hypothetical protein
VASVIVALVTAGYFRKTQDKNKEKKSREKLVEQIQRDELIHFTLKELRRKYITDRVYIIQFHNGGTFYTQAPMQKASVTYERFVISRSSALLSEPLKQFPSLSSSMACVSSNGHLKAWLRRESWRECGEPSTSSE